MARLEPYGMLSVRATDVREIFEDTDVHGALLVVAPLGCLETHTMNFRRLVNGSDRLLEDKHVGTIHFLLPNHGVEVRLGCTSWVQR